ncbi:MAG: FAD:protein FMN transferase [Pseudomonadales bacterium]|nr:FAD:protein FMN transferase [Pseudomonadales bacterium]NNM10383.1 FAD:protein FMN transferase [Pseudomonadales bacterium]
MVKQRIYLIKSRCLAAAFLFSSKHKLNRFFVIAALLALVSCSQGTRHHEFSGATMGTHFRVLLTQLSGADIESLPGIEQAVQDELASVSQQMSTYIESSEISRFNKLPAAECLPVSEQLLHVTRTAMEIAAASGGAFNPLLGPLIERWGFGREHGTFVLPAREEIEMLRKTIATENISFGVAPARLCKHADSVALDLSAIAKGHGVDRIAALLERNKLHSYLVDIGGEMRVSGLNKQLKLWHLAVEAPERLTKAGEAGVASLLRLTSAAVATSGDYRNFINHDGQFYSHTLDPETGTPVTHQLASVTVIADSAMRADAWATALLAAGPEQAIALAGQQNLAVLLLKRSASSIDKAQPPADWQPGQGDWYSWSSPEMQKYLVTPG